MTIINEKYLHGLVDRLIDTIHSISCSEEKDLLFTALLKFMNIELWSDNLYDYIQRDLNEIHYDHYIKKAIISGYAKLPRSTETNT